jgi:hypothetical protein
VPVVLVVVLLPVANDRAGFVNVVEGIHVQALVTHTIVEGFNVPVAPGLTWWNVVNAKLANSEFVEGVGNEFGPVIAPQHQGCSALGNDFLYVVDNFLARDSTVSNV